MDGVDGVDGIDLNTALRESIATICGVPESAVVPTAGLKELGVDSLAAAEIITDVEIRTGVELPMDILRGLNDLRTVGQVMDHLGGRLKGPAAPSPT
jgi:acyl carrier protein